MSDSASVTASSLTISDNRPRRTGGCVGIFFQLFDWNRRFAKKKLFSKRLLPPDRSKEASKKFGGDGKLPKLRLIADENSGGFPNMNKNGVSTVNSTTGKNAVQTPSLVARLMGLESMPSVQRDKLQKSVGNKDELEKETTRQEFRPQKLQKTGMADRRNVTRFGAEALQLKNVLSRSRKHHHPKLASPIKTTAHHSRKSNTSRLIGAATRILEPRSRSKYAITYAHSSRTERMKPQILDSSLSCSNQPQPSCKNCGNPLHIAESTQTSVFDSANHFQHGNSRFDQDQLQDFPTKFSSSKDFVALNRSLSGRTRSRVAARVEDTRYSYPSQGQKRHLAHIRKQDEGFGGKHQGQNGKNNDGMMFRFSSSPMKNRCEVSTKVEKRRNQNDLNTRKKPQIEKLRKPVSFNGDYLKLGELTSQIDGNGTPRKRTAANIFDELICALNMEKQVSQSEMEFSPQKNHLPHYLNHGYNHNTRLCLKRNSEKAGAIIGYKNNNHLSPGSVLENSFSNDSCCSSSLEDSSGRMQNTDSMSYSYDESQFQESEPNLFYSSSELVDTLTEIMWTKFGNFFGSENSKTRYQLKRFMFDSLIEYLDSKYGQHSNSWMGSKVLIDEVMEEVMRWMDFIGLDAYEVAERDMRCGLGKVMDFEVESYETCAKIEGDLLKMLVDEIIVDLVQN